MPYKNTDMFACDTYSSGFEPLSLIDQIVQRYTLTRRSSLYITFPPQEYFRTGERDGKFVYKLTFKNIFNDNIR